MQDRGLPPARLYPADRILHPFFNLTKAAMVRASTPTA